MYVIENNTSAYESGYYRFSKIYVPVTILLQYPLGSMPLDVLWPYRHNCNWWCANTNCRYRYPVWHTSQTSRFAIIMHTGPAPVLGPMGDLDVESVTQRHRRARSGSALVAVWYTRVHSSIDTFEQLSHRSCGCIGAEVVAATQWDL